MHCNKDRRRDRPQLVAIMNLRDDQIALRNYYYYRSICIVLAAFRLLSNDFSDSFSLSLAQNYSRIYDGIQRATESYKFRTVQSAARIGDTIYCAS